MPDEPHVDIDWRSMLFDPAEGWLPRLHKLAKRRFWNESLAEAAYTAALERLLERDFARLRAYQGRCSPSTFIHSVFRNLLEDYAIAQFGKCRPPVWVQQLGATWSEVYKRLCCEHRTPDELRHAPDWAHLPHGELDAICRSIRGRVIHCGSRVLFADIDIVPEPQLAVEPGTTPADIAAQEQLGDILATLAGHLAIPAGMAELPEACLDVRLDPIETVLMRMVYGDSLSISAAARLLGEPEHQIRALHAQILARFRRALELRGIDSLDALL
jgi:DNA-directed RNA polymerase specialized sigma24 family protein